MLEAFDVRSAEGGVEFSANLTLAERLLQIEDEVEPAGQPAPQTPAPQTQPAVGPFEQRVVVEADYPATIDLVEKAGTKVERTNPLDAIKAKYRAARK